jgi:glycosyltransferase involved in cell wall biosynthesis
MLIKAFKLLLRKDFAIDLVIVGDGPDEQTYKKMVHSLDLDDKVHFLSKLSDSDLINYYQKAEMFVFSSSVEGMPLVLLEAMYFGKPIVATAVGGIPEIVENGYNGYLVDSDPLSLSNGIQKVLEHPDLKQVFGRRSQEILTKKLSCHNLKETLSLFEKIVILNGDNAV